MVTHLLERALRRDQRQRRRLLPHRHRAQRARRLHRAAQLRPSGVCGGGCLRLCDSDRQLRLALVLRPAVRVPLLDPARPPARHTDPSAAGRLPGHRHHRGIGDHPISPGLDPLHVAHRWQRRQEPLDAVLPRPQPVPQQRRVQPRQAADRRLPAVHADPRLGSRGPVRTARLGADAQSVGPGAQEHPRGRERRPGAGQERVGLQDAEPHPRRTDRLRRGSPAGRPAAIGAAGALRHHAHVLCVHHRRARRDGAGERPHRRHRHLLLRDPVRRQLPQRGHPSRSAARLVRHTEQLRAGEEHRVRVRAGGLVVFRPQGIFGDRREQAFDVR